MKPLATFVALIFVCSPAWAISLKGGVQYSEQIQINKGTIKDDNWTNNKGNVHQNSDNYWYMIPSWLAGTWQRNDETGICSYDPGLQQITKKRHKFPVKDQVRYGVQMDRNGNIWHCAQVPQFITETNLADATASYQETWNAFSQVNDTTVLKCSTGRETRFNQGVQTESWEQESIVTITPLPGKKILMNGLLRCFGNDRNLIDVNVNYTVMQQVSPFVSLASYGGQDMSKLFCDFLAKQGKQDLIPDNRVAKYP